MADFEVSISKTLSLRGKEWQTFEVLSISNFEVSISKTFC